MKNKLIHLLCAFVFIFGFAMMMPTNADAAEVSVEKAQEHVQVQINYTKGQAVITWENFTDNNYKFAVKCTDGSVNNQTTTLTNSGANILHHHVTALKAGNEYRVAITDVNDASKIIRIGFYYGKEDRVSSASFNTKTNTLSWVDRSPNAYKYRLRFYTSKAAAESGISTMPTYDVSKGTSSLPFNSTICPAGVYWVSVQPFYAKSTFTYYAGQKTAVAKVLYAPATVLTKAGVGAIKVKWSAVKGATSYVVKNLTTGDSVNIPNATTRSYIFKNLKGGTSYKFCVYAKLASNYGVLTSPKSATVKETTPKITSGKVTNLQVLGVNEKISLTWNAVKDADGYYIYYKKSGDPSYTLWKSTKNTSYTTTYFNNSNVNHAFLVKPYTVFNGKKYVSSTKPSKVVVNPYQLTHDMASVRTIGYYSKTTTTTSLYNSMTSSSAVMTIGSGKNVEQLEAENAKYGRCKILYNKKVYYCKRSNIRSYSAHYTSKRYPTAVKEAFVRNKSSQTKYLIWVSQFTQQVTIFQGSKGNWKAFKSFICATGKHTTRSARGTYKITRKENGWFYSSTYEKYITHFFGRNSFHTRIHYNGGGYADATIGRPASNGCVRLYDNDAYYIWKNMPIGTTVVSY